MKKLILLIITIIGGQLLMRGAETAESILKHVVDNMRQGPVDVQFDITGSGISQSGIIILDNNKFVIKSDELSIWYNGKTQWTLSPSINEVNISTPTRDELAEINPLIILSSLSSQFNAEMAGSMTGTYDIRLVSRDTGAAISSAIVKVNSASWSPRAIELHTSTGQKYTITVKALKKLTHVDSNTFKFNPKEYPGVEIIDLR